MPDGGANVTRGSGSAPLRATDPLDRREDTHGTNSRRRECVWPTDAHVASRPQDRTHMSAVRFTHMPMSGRSPLLTRPGWAILVQPSGSRPARPLVHRVVGGISK